jgi:hypothetical protein
VHGVNLYYQQGNAETVEQLSKERVIQTLRCSTASSTKNKQSNARKRFAAVKLKIF